MSFEVSHAKLNGRNYSDELGIGCGALLSFLRIGNCSSFDLSNSWYHIASSDGIIGEGND